MTIGVGLLLFLVLLVSALGVAITLGVRRITARRRPDPPVSPADFALPYEEVVFLSRDGITLRGWFMPASPRRGTIIFCHGQAGSMDADLHYAPAFHEHGYDVLMFDFRGHGRSGGNSVSMGYLEREDLLAAIEWLGRRGITKLGVLGFSMGGAVAMMTAPSSPAVCAVVSDGGFASLDAPVEGWFVKKGAPGWLAGLLSGLTLWAAGIRLGVPLQQTRPIDYVADIAPRGLFLIQGGRDIFVPVAHAQALFERAGQPKELWIEPAANHRQVDLVAPEQYLPRILAFFDRFFPASSPCL